MDELEKEQAQNSTQAVNRSYHNGEQINASGHKQELQRNFNLLAICGVAITLGSTWVTVGGSVVSYNL